MNTPFQWTKQVASHWGGTRNGTIVHWPAGIEEKGGLRIAVHPRHRHRPDRSSRPPGCPSRRSSTACSSRRSRARACCTRSTTPAPRSATTSSTSRCSATAASTTRAGARSPSTRRRGSWSAATLPAFDDDVWELYDGSDDYSQARNLAAEQPERLAELQRLWLIEATKYNVLPIDDRSAERLNPDLAGRPTLIRGNSQLFFPGMGRLSENSVVSIKNKSFSVTAEIDVPDGGAEGVIIAQGGRFGGWAVYAKDGKAKFVYNVARHPGVHHRSRRADPGRQAPGADGVRLRRRRPGQGRRRHALLRRQAGRQGPGRGTQPMIFSADETTDIGYESGTTVTPDYTAETSRFTGKIQWVQIDLGNDDHDHFIDPEERLRVAMARQ